MFNFIKKNALWVRIGAGVALIAGVVLALLACFLSPKGKAYSKSYTSTVLTEEYEVEYVWDFDEETVSVKLLLETDGQKVDGLPNILSQTVNAYIAKQFNDNASLKALYEGLKQASVVTDSNIVTFVAAHGVSTDTVDVPDVDQFGAAKSRKLNAVIAEAYAEYTWANGEVAKIANGLVMPFEIKGTDIYVENALLQKLMGSDEAVKFGQIVCGWVGTAEITKVLTGGGTEIVLLQNNGRTAEFFVGVGLAIVALVAESFVCAAVYLKKKEH